ncbi:MAG: trypsin-like peptidase domain-containing protein [Verrucomicrobia bacterium]|nr:trypsin-like peptidase domain-containing protein [Verrucomicrobiota bacterium]
MKWKSFFMAVLVSLIFGGAGLRSGAADAAKEPSPIDLARRLNQAFIDVADKVSPAVVVIQVAHKAGFGEDDEENPFYEMLPPDFRKRLEEEREKQRKEREKSRKFHRKPVFSGEGSGVVVRKEGYIITNRHVVDGAEKILVRLKDGTELDAEVRGVDAQSDLAVIKVEPKGVTLAVAKLADSDKTRVGEFAIAIGAPFLLDYSVTFGHVSAKGRSGIIQDRDMDQDFIQTDASINPGNSGGPLVNIEGEVIGINTLIRGMSTGIGFAIPSNFAKEVTDKLISDGKFVRAYLGVRISPLKGENEYRDLITGVSDGVVITEIPPDGPAAKSDLKPGDVVTSVDGKAVSTVQQLKNEVRGKKIGAPVTLDVHRFGKNIKVKVKPEARPDEMPSMASRRKVEEEDKASTFGLTVQAVTKELAEQYNVEKTEGVLVTEVDQGSVAERKGIKPGDVVTEVNGKAVSSPKQFLQEIKSADAKRGIVIIYTTKGTSKIEVLRDDGE